MTGEEADWYELMICKQGVRITELTAEVEKYKAALEEIVNPGSFGWDSSKPPDAVWLARNALREG